MPVRLKALPNPFPAFMTPVAYAAGGLGPTVAALSSYSVIYVIRSYFFPAFKAVRGCRSLLLTPESPSKPNTPPNSGITNLLLLEFSAHAALDLAFGVALCDVVALIVVLLALA